MRKIAFALAATASLFVTTQVFARDIGDNNPSVQVSGKVERTYKVLKSDFNSDFRGSYFLEDGRTLTLTDRSNHFYAQVEGKAPVEIRSVNPQEFVAADGMHLSFAVDGKVTLSQAN